MNPPVRAICWWQCCSAQLKPPRDTSAPASLHTQVVALAEPPLRGWDAPRLKMGFPKGSLSAGSSYTWAVALTVTPVKGWDPQGVKRAPLRGMG